MLDTARWMLGIGWPKRISSSGGIYVQKDGKSNISDTQSAIFEYDGLTATAEQIGYALSACAAAAISVPSSIVPVFSIVTDTISGMSIGVLPRSASALITPFSAHLICSTQARLEGTGNG